LFIVADHDASNVIAKRLTSTPFVRFVEHEIERVCLPTLSVCFPFTLLGV
jgi:hypothetical protein